MVVVHQILLVVDFMLQVEALLIFVLNKIVYTLAGFYSSSRNGNGGYGGGISGGSGSTTYSSYNAGTGGTQTVAGTSYYGGTANSTAASYG